MTKQNKKRVKPTLPKWRFYVVVSGIVLVFSAIISRFVFLQIVDAENLVAQGDNRTIRTKSDDVERGMIFDRNGIELAISTPVNTIWADPKVIAKDAVKHSKQLMLDPRWHALADVLHMNRKALITKVTQNPNRRFMYLKRQVEPAMANYVAKLKIPGVFLRRESKRYYPTSEISAHVVGFTNVDGQGIDGVEKLFDKDLSGVAGKRVIRKDAKNREIEVINAQASVAPENIYLTIDQRLQAMTYRALKSAVQSYQAASGSAVIVDVQTGEILALVNSPSYNPNNRSNVAIHQLRNRAITDIFEPGSTLKPLAVVSALEFGSYQSDAVIDTAPGWMRVGGSRVTDGRNNGKLSLAGVVQKSSNVGVAQLALSMPKEVFLNYFYNVGFGMPTGIELIGESGGLFGGRSRWSDFEIATLSFGYSVGVTTLQLAKVYSILGNDGVSMPLTILKRKSSDFNQGERVFSEGVTPKVLEMMESVIQDGGTGQAAQVKGYRVAGKTGTAIKAVAGGYGDDYIGIFAGVAPVSNPRFAVVVMINDPAGDYYHGGEVAAPVFSEIMSGALQLLNVAPDDLSPQQMYAGRDASNV